MAKLYLVRHAQASFGLENYDCLSEHGVKQCAHIPKHFTSGAPLNIHSLYSGNMQRHLQTVQHGFKDIQSSVMPSFNEFDHENVLRVYKPEIADREKTMALVMSQSDPKKFLEDEFEKAMLRWMREEGTTSYKEPFKLFSERCVEALQQVIATARKEKHKEVVVVTSGGFISYILTYVMGLPPEKMVGLNLGIVNTSVTALLFNDRKISLNYFNNYSHLPSGMVTLM